MQAAEVQQPRSLLQGKQVQNHPRHCRDWVKRVPPQTEPQQRLHPSEGAPQEQVGTGKGEMIHRAISGSFRIWCRRNWLHSD